MGNLDAKKNVPSETFNLKPGIFLHWEYIKIPDFRW